MEAAHCHIRDDTSCDHADPKGCCAVCGFFASHMDAVSRDD
jgi:hypothetical protein